jgi:predicted enzyme related to lactoylglutathione lyase
MPGARPSLIEFPADDLARALRFWEGLLGAPLDERARGEGYTASLPYFAVDDMAAALERVRALGGSVVHPGDAWSVCRDSEGTPFGLAAGSP